MSQKPEEEKVLLPHHEQQKLCTTRLPYRQGRKLTAVKAYTISNESNHLLIFGVPSLNLRQEAKSLFKKFGNLLHFNITNEHPTEQFTETYHAVFEKIQAARRAKKMLDTTTFYGGALHICYAPELEQIHETRNKLLQRQRDVLNRLRNLEKESEKSTKVVESAKPAIPTKEVLWEKKKLNMGEVNIIGVGKQIRDVYKNKRKSQDVNIVIEKKFKPNKDTKTGTEETTKNIKNKEISENNRINDSEVEIVDCTSVYKETISNINEALNYNRFGNEIIKKVVQKPVNKIKFHVGNKK